MTTTYLEKEFNTDLEVNWSVGLKEIKKEGLQNDSVTFADFNDLKALADDRSVIFSSVKDTVTVGRSFVVSNVGDYSYQVKSTTDDPLNPTKDLIIMNKGDVFCFVLTENDDAAGEWRIIPWGLGKTAISSIGFTSNTSSILISPTLINGAGGTVNFDLPQNYQSLKNFGSTDGIVVFRKGTPSTFALVNLIAGESTTIDYPAGAEGNPTISVSKNPNFESATFSQIIISGNEIKSKGSLADERINIKATTGVILNDVLEVTPSNVVLEADMSVTGDLTLTGSIKNPSVSQAWVTFSDDGNGNITRYSTYNVQNVTGSVGNYTISFGTAMQDANYAVFVSNVAGGNILAVRVTSKTTSSINIQTFTSQGILATADTQVSVIVFASV